MSFDARKEVTSYGAIVNPGSGPVKETNMGEAILNMYHFRKDLRDSLLARSDLYIIITNKQKEDGGRYLFGLLYTTNTKTIEFEIEMPGLPLNEVRYMRTKGQNIWDFPRLYVDGNSGVWTYALDDILDTINK